MNINIKWQNIHLTKNMRAKQKNQKPCVIWFTGLSGSGKSTLANELEKRLFKLGHHTYLLDGDNIRHGLNKDLGFSHQDRIENIRRIGEVANLFIDSGLIVLTAFISPFAQERHLVRNLVKTNEFIEIFVDVPLEICEQRDIKGLYKLARQGEIKNFTGISSPYEKPNNPDIHLDNHQNTIAKNVDIIEKYLKKHKYIKP